MTDYLDTTIINYKAMANANRFKAVQNERDCFGYSVLNEINTDKLIKSNVRCKNKIKNMNSDTNKKRKCFINRCFEKIKNLFMNKRKNF